MAENKVLEFNSGTNKEIYSFLLDFKERYFKLKSTFSEGIMKKKVTFSQEELDQAREAWIRG
jgi:hypothetical protein